MNQDERNLLLTIGRIMCSQMQEVADNQMKSIGMIRGSLREHLPELKAAFAPFQQEGPAVQTPTQGGTASSGLKIQGVSRVADNRNCLLLSFNQEPTADEMRHIHDTLREIINRGATLS